MTFGSFVTFAMLQAPAQSGAAITNVNVIDVDRGQVITGAST